jgi:hypothetical protein
MELLRDGKRGFTVFPGDMNWLTYPVEGHLGALAPFLKDHRKPILQRPGRRAVRTPRMLAVSPQSPP